MEASKSASPGRKAREAASAWGRADLARRIARLPVPLEARPRVARFVEDEVARAKAEWLREAAPLAGLECPKCRAPIGDDLRKSRRDDELLAVVRALGLEKLAPEDVARVLAEARDRGPAAPARAAGEV